MEMTISVVGRDSADELRSLRAWLAEERSLRNGVRLVDSAEVVGTLGSVVDVLAVTVGPGGLVTALATALVSWIRHRTSDVTLRVTRPDGTKIELTAARLPGADPAAVAALAAQLSVSSDRVAGDDG